MAGTPNLLMPCDPRSVREPDESFRGEHDAARAAGFAVALFDDSALSRAEPVARVLRAVPEPPAPGAPMLHRGWMMPPARYAALHTALTDRGWALHVSPAAYAQAHHLPRAYPLIAGLTAPSVWIEGTDLDEAWRAASELGAGPCLVKDYVKSAKHRWAEACFIPDVRDRARFDAVVRAFIAVRAERLEVGLVFRKVLPFRLLRTDMRGMPVHDEWRMFFFRGAPLLAQLYPELAAEPARFAPIVAAAARLESPFISVDVARLDDDEVRIVEVGDGGVSGLPIGLDDGAFYTALFTASTRASRG